MEIKNITITYEITDKDAIKKSGVKPGMSIDLEFDISDPIEETIESTLELMRRLLWKEVDNVLEEKDKSPHYYCGKRYNVLVNEYRKLGVITIDGIELPNGWDVYNESIPKCKIGRRKSVAYFYRFKLESQGYKIIDFTEETADTRPELPRVFDCVVYRKEDRLLLANQDTINRLCFEYRFSGALAVYDGWGGWEKLRALPRMILDENTDWFDLVGLVPTVIDATAYDAMAVYIELDHLNLFCPHDDDTSQDFVKMHPYKVHFSFSSDLKNILWVVITDVNADFEKMDIDLDFDHILNGDNYKFGFFNEMQIREVVRHCRNQGATIFDLSSKELATKQLDKIKDYFGFSLI